MIREFRRATYDRLLADLPPTTAIHRTIPDDVGSLPAVVVGRVGIAPSENLTGAWELDLTVYVVGSRNTHADSQDELDDAAWEALQSLDSEKISTSMVVAARVQNVTPALTQIAGVEYPCYMVSLVGTTNICR